MDDLSSIINNATGASAVPAPVRLNNPGALMKNGKLMSFNSPDEGMQALDSNLQSYGKKGVNTLAGVIAKWAPPNENDTQSYISDASKTTGIDPNQQIDLSDPNTRRLIGSAIVKHENGAKYAQFAQSQGGFDAGVINDAIASVDNPPPSKATGSAENVGKVSNFDETPASAMLSVASGIGANIIAGWRGLSELAQGNGIDAANKAVQEEQKKGTYQPEEGTTSAKFMGLMGSRLNPLNYPAEAGKYLGEKTMQATGSPALATAVETGINAAPGVLIPGARNPIAQAINKVNPAAIARNEIALRSAQGESIPTIIPAGEKAPVQNVVQQMAEKAPPVPETYAQDVAVEGKALPPDIQKARSDLLARVGIAPQDQRISAIKGDAVSANDEMQAAKTNNPLGVVIKQKLDNERAALTNHAENIVQSTGGTLGTDEATLNAKGQTISAPFDALKDYFKKATDNLYEEADKQAGGAPSVNLNNTSELLSHDDEFMGKAENGALRTGIQAYMKRMGMVADDGSMNPITAKQAEGLRQYINSQWSPGTSGLAGKIKTAIDDDVFSSAGGDIYQHARQMYALKKATLDNPSGISKIMDADPQTPINRVTPYNKIPDKLTSLSPAQFQHVIGVLDNMPEELQPLAQAAKNEIKGHMANQLLDAGAKTQTQWNAPGVSALFKNNTAKYPMVFNPDELAKIKDLRDAGDVLFIKGGYPGGGVQPHNLINAGLMTIPSVGVAAGETMGTMMAMPTIGAMAGGALGKKVAGKVSEKLSMGAVNKRFGISNIKDFPK